MRQLDSLETGEHSGTTTPSVLFLAKSPPLVSRPPETRGGLFAKGGAFSKMDPPKFFGAFGAGVHF